MSNINIERTEREFDYKVVDLKPSSQKLIYRICEICGKEELRKARMVIKFKQTKCHCCAGKINASKNKEIRIQKIKEFWKCNKHPRLGVKHRAESKRQISETRLANPPICSQETRQKLSDANRGEKNGFYGKKHNKETRKIMSEKAKLRAKTGKDSILYGNKYFAKPIPYTMLCGEIINMRSSWEIKVAKYLDGQDIKWKYESQTFPVIYEFEGKIKEGTYIPDFLLDGGEIWEVKGYWRKDAQIKFEAFKKQYPNERIRLLQKIELVEMGIL